MCIVHLGSAAGNVHACCPDFWPAWSLVFRIFICLFASPEKQPVNAVFSSLPAAFEMKCSSARRSVAAAVVCVVGLFNLTSCQYMMCWLWPRGAKKCDSDPILKKNLRVTSTVSVISALAMLVTHVKLHPGDTSVFILIQSSRHRYDCKMQVGRAKKQIKHQINSLSLKMPS